LLKIYEMKHLFIVMAICHGFTCIAQPVKDPVLLGIVNVDTLSTDPHHSWYGKNYRNYTSHPQVLSQFNPALLKNIRIEAFFGNWCGDSKRELPRFVKLLDEIKFEKQKFTLVGLGASDSLYKQSPSGEEKGKGIFRVPVFIVYRNGTEIGRINEYPVYSLERDLLNILKGHDYSPNYKTFSLVTTWLNTDLLKDSNVSVKGLTAQLKPLAENEYELNSLAQLLARQGRKEASLKLLMINANIFPGSIIALLSLAEAQIESNDITRARILLEKGMEITRSPEHSKKLLELFARAKKE
jgi:thiol-disulfide isomerase/thioredoxin